MKRRERWQRLALQASEQSRRATPPEIALPVRLRDLFSMNNRAPSDGAFASGPESYIVLAESEMNTLLRDVLPANSGPVTLAVGPEGGWTSPEQGWFKENKWTSASLGETILRAETAAIVATALALNALR